MDLLGFNNKNRQNQTAKDFEYFAHKHGLPFKFLITI